MAGQGESSSTGNSIQNNNIPVNQNLTRPRMPKPGEKNAPVFDPERPEELGRFFERVEDWFIDCDIEENRERKRRIVHYLDPDSEIQWKALSMFEDGTYNEFKAQVMQAYPAAEDVMKGSVTALKRKIKKIGPVEADDRNELLTLVRVITAEVMKLKRITPPIHTNRELVDLFLSRLSQDFAGRVAGKLSVRSLVSKDKGPEEYVRNTEDMYDIEEVMEMAKHTSLEHANPFGKFLLGAPVRQGESTIKLEEAVARLTDSLNIQAQYNKQVEQKLTSMQNFMNQSRTQPQQTFSGTAQTAQPSTYNRNPAYATNSTGMPSGCFYCGGSHRISDCEHVNRHLDVGWIKKVEGRLRHKDGSSFVRDPSKSIKDQVESMNTPKPGVIPMNKMGERPNLYQNAHRASNFVQNQLAIDEQEGLKGVLELIQQMGVSQAYRMLSTQPEIVPPDEDEDLIEWQQNFDKVQ
jgi:hypothetical protein